MLQANKVFSHREALGVVLTALGRGNMGIENDPKELLYTDLAVAIEAAGMSIDMVLVGSGAGNTTSSSSAPAAANTEDMLEAVSELQTYMIEMEHQKIIWGVAIGVALIKYDQEDSVDAVIEEMRSDK